MTSSWTRKSPGAGEVAAGAAAVFEASPAAPAGAADVVGRVSLGSGTSTALSDSVPLPPPPATGRDSGPASPKAATSDLRVQDEVMRVAPGVAHESGTARDGHGRDRGHRVQEKQGPRRSHRARASTRRRSARRIKIG